MVDWPWKSCYSSAIKIFIFCVTGLGDSAFASCRKVTRDQKKNLVNRREVSNGKRSKAHSRKFCDRENKRRTRWDVCNATKVEFGPGLQRGTREKSLDEGEVVLEDTKGEGQGISMGWRNDHYHRR